MLSHYQLHFGSQFLAKTWSKMPKWTIFGKIHIHIWQHCSNISHFRFLHQTMLPECTLSAKYLGILAFSGNIWLKCHTNVWPTHHFTTSISCWPACPNRVFKPAQTEFELSHSPSTEENTSPRSSSLDLSSPLPFPAGPPARIGYLSQPKLNSSSVTHRPPKRTHLQEVHRWIPAHHFRFLLAYLPACPKEGI